MRYYAQGNRYAFYMTPTAVMLTFAKERADAAKPQGPDEVALALQFVGGDPKVEPKGSERAAGVINDLCGSDPLQWHTQIPQFRDVVYTDLLGHSQHPVT